MPVTVSGGIVVPTGSSVGVTRNYAYLKQEVAACVDGVGDPEIERYAGRAINRVVRELNLHHVYDFTRAVLDDKTLVDDQHVYTLSDRAFIIDEVQLIDRETDEVAATLVYEDWNTFNNKAPASQDAEGIPTTWSLYNRWNNKQIWVWPEPTSEVVLDYSLRVHFHERIEGMTRDEDTLSGPTELEEVIVAGGEFYILWWRERTNPAAWGSARNLYLQKRDDLARLDKNMAGKLIAFSLGFEE